LGFFVIPGEGAGNRIPDIFKETGLLRFNWIGFHNNLARDFRSGCRWWRGRVRFGFGGGGGLRGFSLRGVVPGVGGGVRWGRVGVLPDNVAAGSAGVRAVAVSSC